MTVDEKELQEFSLEDIMKEFGSEPEPEEEPPVMPVEEELPEKPEEEPVPEAEPIPEDMPSLPVQEESEPEKEPSAVTESTIRLDRIPRTVGKVNNAQHIDDEDEPYLPPQPEEKAEPYSDEWEPEYEQPISEYVPPKPIVFPTRSRLQELKKKLVSGPEKLYYKLSEQGRGKLQLAILVNLLVLILTAVGTVLYDRGIIGENRLRLMVFVQFFCMLFAAIMGSDRLVEGAADLLKKRFSLNTMLLFTFVVCCVDGAMGLHEKRIPCCAAFSLQMTMSLWNAYHVRNTKLGQLDTMRKAIKLDSLVTVDDYMDGQKGVLRGEGQVEDFMDTYDKPTKMEKVVSVYAIVACCLSVAAGVTAGVLHGFSAGIQVAAVTTLAAVPASMHVFLSRPMSVLERKFHDVGVVLCGWQGVKGLSGKVVFPMDHRDLFPTGVAKMNGVKFFGTRQPDQVIAYATALMEADDGVLAPLFTALLDKRNGRHYTAERLTAYDGGGIGAEVNGEPVLAGSISFLKDMGVELPEGIRIHQAVCVAVDGEFCGLFAITYDKDRITSAGMTSICSYRGVKPVLVGGRFVLTERFIYDQFGVNPKRLCFADAETSQNLAQKQPAEDAPALALITGNGLTPFAYAVTGARTLKNAVTAGLVVSMIGGVLGILMMGTLAVLGATYLLTPANLFLYELVWLLPGLLITEWTRSI